MKLENLYETPQIISGVSELDKNLLKQDCQNALKSKSCKIEKTFSEKTKLYKYEKSQQEGLYILATGDRIDYACNYKKVELSEKTLPVKFGVRQVLIHNFPGSSAFTTGIGAVIFWDYLFDNFKCLVSDNQQTIDGKKFWRYRIKEAFEKKMTVRVINTNDNTFVDVNSLSELEQLDQNIWGESKWFQRVVIAIY